MEAPEGPDELRQLSDIYAELRTDAKQIVIDLEGGVAMWREASAGAFASAGFLVILALTATHDGNPLDFWGSLGLTVYVGLAAVIAVVMLAFGVYGFRKYYQLKSKYSGLFSRVNKLE